MSEVRRKAKTTPRRAAGRPAGGSELIVRAVLDEVMNQLVAGGFGAISVEAIARAAGVNKTSVYRRWPSKAELLIAALRAKREGQPPFRESGDLHDDLTRLLAEKAESLATPRGRAIASALSALQHGSDPAIRDTLRALRYELPSAMIEKAVARGELPAGIDPVFVAELLYAPIFHRLLVLNEVVGRDYIASVVEHVLAGVAARGHQKQR
jgi:AcrR family transcriptional regulator